LIIVAFSIRCRDMCDEYKAWKKAEKLAALSYRYQSAQRLGAAATSGGRGAGGGAGSGAGGVGRGLLESVNFFSHRAGNNKDTGSTTYPPIRTTRPIFGPSCCCCPNPN